MPRQRRRRQGYYYDDYDMPVRRAWRRPFLQALTPFITTITVLLLSFLVVWIALNFETFLVILHYALFIAIGFAVLGILYVIVRIITAISQRVSAASMAAAKTKLERQRVKQSQVQMKSQQARLAREDYVFYQKYEQPQPEYQRSPRRTRVLREEAHNDDERPASLHQDGEHPRQTRNLRGPDNNAQQSLVRSGGADPRTVPHIAQLIGRTIKIGQTDMLHGFEILDGAFAPVRGEIPFLAIIAGRSGSGKTRRIIVMIFQALLIFQAMQARYKITVCDPHAYKPDGLAKVLAPFAPWLRFARTNEEIIAAAKEHTAEMKSRLTAEGSMHGEGLMPRLIIFDEFPALMKSDDLSNEDKRAIAKSVRESATQYRGVFGSAWIVGQEFTQDALFDTAIRKDAEAILCHQLSDEYVTFLFPRDLKTQRLVQQIERRECVFKNNDNQVKRIITTTVPDEQIASMVAYLVKYVPRQVQQQRRTRPIQQQPQAQSHALRSRQPPVQKGVNMAPIEEDFPPKRIVPRRVQQSPPSAVWQDPAGVQDKQQYGYPSRSLHRTRLQASEQPPAQQQPRHTTEDRGIVREADGSPDDTVLVPELPWPSQSSTAASPRTEALGQHPAPGEQLPTEAQPNPFSRLAQLRKRKK